MAADGAQFDIVTALEIVEHVADVDAFLGALSGLGTIQYADIKISLKLKPSVNESNFVRLEIEQQIARSTRIKPLGLLDQRLVI